MIKQIRLDERLIHGQVAVKWSRILGVNRIIVADDEAASNGLMQKALMMAAPNDVKVAIVGVERAIELCRNPKADALSILVIVSNPKALLAVATALPNAGGVNVGNYGRVAPQGLGQEPLRGRRRDRASAQGRGHRPSLRDADRPRGRCPGPGARSRVGPAPGAFRKSNQTTEQE